MLASPRDLPPAFSYCHGRCRCFSFLLFGSKAVRHALIVAQIRRDLATAGLASCVWTGHWGMLTQVWWGACACVCLYTQVDLIFSNMASNRSTQPRHASSSYVSLPHTCQDEALAHTCPSLRTLYHIHRQSSSQQRQRNNAHRGVQDGEQRLPLLYLANSNDTTTTSTPSSPQSLLPPDPWRS